MPKPKSPKVFVWRRLVGTKLLDAWEERLSFVPETHRVVTYLKSGKSARIDVYFEKRSEGKHLLKEFGGEVRELSSANWVRCQERRFYKVIKNRLCLASDEESVPAESRKLPILLIPAGMAFGTGEHPTTRMCLYEVIALSKNRRLEILDIGTGSGVLALAAAKLGHDVTGIDNDKDSIKEAKRNANRNHMNGLVGWEHADGLTYKPEKKFDVVIANVFLGPLLKMLKSFKKWAKPNALLILSGVLHEQYQELLSALEKEKFTLVKCKRVGKWCCILVSKGKFNPGQ